MLTATAESLRRKCVDGTWISQPQELNIALVLRHAGPPGLFRLRDWQTGMRLQEHELKEERYA